MEGQARIFAKYTDVQSTTEGTQETSTEGASLQRGRQGSGKRGLSQDRDGSSAWSRREKRVRRAACCADTGGGVVPPLCRKVRGQAGDRAERATQTWGQGLTRAGACRVGPEGGRGPRAHSDRGTGFCGAGEPALKDVIGVSRRD